jgi:hypothetical protein
MRGTCAERSKEIATENSLKMVTCLLAAWAQALASPLMPVLMTWLTCCLSPTSQMRASVVGVRLQRF